MARVQKLPTAEGYGTTSRPIHPRPVPHIRRRPRGPLKGWSGSYQPLPAPRLLLTPYLGCSAGCSFCFLNDFPGLYQLASKKQVLTVYEDYDRFVERELRRLRIAPPVHLSPFTDPFQPLNHRYRLSEKTIKVCVDQNLPVDLVTRHPVPREVVAMLQYPDHSRIQISLDPLERDTSVPPVNERLDHAAWIRERGLDAVPRIDPLIPGADGIEAKLRDVLEAIDRRSFPHVVVGFAQLSASQLNDLDGSVREQYRRDTGGNGWVPTPDGVDFVLDLLAELCQKYNVSLGVLGEPDWQDRYGTFPHLFHNTLPVSQRRSETVPFEPLTDCPGDCLRCPQAVCGIETLRGVRRQPNRLTSRRWDRWGRLRHQSELLP